MPRSAAVVGALCLLSALFCLLPTAQAAWPGRHMLQAVQVPTNCSAPDDSWTRQAFNCSIPPAYTAECSLATQPAGNVNCQVVNDEKLNIRTAMVCPVRDCVTVCDTVVMQNFFPADAVIAFAELLAAWKPAVAGC